MDECQCRSTPRVGSWPITIPCIMICLIILNRKCACSQTIRSYSPTKVEGIDRTQEKIEEDLATRGRWAYQWKMAFNSDITKQAVEIIFSVKNKITVHPELNIRRQCAYLVNEVFPSIVIHRSNTITVAA